MKNILIILGFFALCLKGNSQKIEIQPTYTPPFKLNQSILFEVFLYNNTSNDLVFFDSRYGGWDSYKAGWQLSVNGQDVPFYRMKDGQEGGGFTKKSIKTLHSGERIEIGGRLIDLKKSGKCVLSYFQEQGSELVVKGYAQNNAAYEESKKITSFKVSTKLEFTVENFVLGTTADKVNIGWNEWSDFKRLHLNNDLNVYDNLTDALKEPGKVYSLSVNCKSMTKQMLGDLSVFYNLKALYLYKIEFDSLPECIGKLNLYELDISTENNKPIVMPSTLKNLTELRNFTLVSASDFPINILKANKIESIILRYSRLTELPNLLNLQSLQYLQIVESKTLANISNANLDKLPNLKKLDISGNKILNDYSAVLACRSLEHLILCYANLSNFSLSVNNFSQLKSLSLYSNPNLTSLPSEVIELSNLESIDVGQTGIKELPKGLSKLPLHRFWVQGTPCNKNNAEYKVLKKKLGREFYE